MEAQREEVCALEAEIAALRRACEEPRAAGEDAGLVQKSLQEIYQSDSEGWASSKDLRSHLEHLESELLFLSTLTGINIRNYSMKTEDLTSTEKTEKSIKKVLQKHRLSGNCHMITFQLEFEILEIQNKESLSSVITDLNIIMEPSEYSELSEFVSRAEERRDLLMFFRSLRFFVEWCDYRKRTFQHLKDKYPEVVHLPEGAASSCMGVRSACQPGFQTALRDGVHIFQVRADHCLEDAHGGRREGFSEAGSSPQSATASPGARPAPCPGDCAPPLQNPAGCAGHRSCSRKPDNISVPSRQPGSSKHAGV
uniref:centromere protein P isoform X3 n=1 Tax=Nyctereutes procyonoides TaxID=34880 RepID=UPI002443CB2B|nr:centromere protein P isoform X3 [Nyctereutes procyonoides]